MHKKAFAIAGRFVALALRDGVSVAPPPPVIMGEVPTSHVLGKLSVSRVENGGQGQVPAAQ